MKVSLIIRILNKSELNKYLVYYNNLFFKTIKYELKTYKEYLKNKMENNV